MRESAAEADPGPKLAATQPGTKLMGKDLLNRDDIPNPSAGIGPLSQFQVKCLMSQLAFAESNFDYALVDSSNTYLGRYQIGAYALLDLKYIKSEYVTKYTTEAVRYPDAWFGTDGLDSAEAFLAGKGKQEKAMFALLKLNRQGDAMACYSQALQLDCDNQQALLNRAGLLHLMGKDKEAKKDLKHLLKLNPQNEYVKDLLSLLR
jgi:tetratricopeptide (TPR) repeat protein